MSRRIAARLIATAACGMGLLGVAPVVAAAQTPPALSVSAAALYAPATHQLLYGVNAQKRVAIASTTKLMTALIVLQHVHKLSTMFTQNDYTSAAVDSQIGLEPGERMSVHDLLLALMLPSADDAAEDLAVNVGHGSVARFVSMMNAEAHTLGLRNTRYTTPIGLDTPGNYSTAADLVKLADYDMTHSAYFARIVGLPRATLSSGNHVRTVTNRNDLVGRYPWIDGVKTGHTLDAGYVLVASGHRGGMALISAVLGTDSETSRDANTLALLDYGAAFRVWTPVRKGQLMARPTVKEQPSLHPTVTAAAGYTRILPRSAPVRVDISVAHQLVGPVPAQSVVGTATVTDGRRVLARIPLVLTRRVPALSGLTRAARFITRPLALAVLVAAAGGAALLLRNVRRRRRIGRRGRELEAT
ncbi:MAG TPA: D-alanyl-D-alanine carboxypeptidase family protein [Solirubrobacteraceae bacterium]|nr:D-alanyl-D-alanine carboxypeptidase family protein [Solirubrobacteraceae bacterium]